MEARSKVLTCLILALFAHLSAAEESPATQADASSDPVDTAGEKRCLSIASIRTTRVLDDQSIVFIMRGKPDYINKLPYRCPGLGFYKSFGYATGLSAVCDLDIITVIESNRRGASCGLGKFMVYDPAEEEEAGDNEQGNKKGPEAGP